MLIECAECGAFRGHWDPNYKQDFIYPHFCSWECREVSENEVKGYFITMRSPGPPREAIEK
jgi:hypothetical protein